MLVTIIGGRTFETDKNVVVMFRDRHSPVMYIANKIEHLYLNGHDIQTIEVLNDKE